MKNQKGKEKSAGTNLLLFPDDKSSEGNRQNSGAVDGWTEATEAASLCKRHLRGRPW